MPRRRREPAPDEVTEVLADANADIPAPTPARRKPRRTTSQVSEAAQQEIHAIVSMAISVVGLLLPATHRMLPEEIDAIFMPLERILMRRAGLKGVSPDARDTILCLLGVVMYVQRVGLVNLTRRRRQPGSPRPVTTGQHTGGGDSATGNVQGARAHGAGNARSAPPVQPRPGDPGELHTVDNALRDLWKSSYIPDGNEAGSVDYSSFGVIE